MAVIHLNDVVKQFAGGVVAVDHLSLEIDDGEFVSLLGPSGCGKTTTLRMLAGLEDLSAGEIRVDETVLSSTGTGVFVPPEKRNMGLVFQSYALWPHMTVAENIAFGLDMHRVPKAEQRERIAAVMKMLQIEGLEKRYSFQLSGGQQQRVALARMLAMTPDVLLLDEPLSNLDARLRLEMRTELKRIHERMGKTTIFVTHDQLEAMTLSTKIAVMKDGQLQQYGEPMEIYRKPANLFVAQFVGSPPINVIRPEDGALFQSAVRSTGSYPETLGAIGVRPEALRIRSNGTPFDSSRNGSGRAGDQWSAAAHVEAILPTGPEWIIQARADDVSLFARTDEEPFYDVGDTCEVTTDVAQFHCFSPAGERVQVGVAV